MSNLKIPPRDWMTNRSERTLPPAMPSPKIEAHDTNRTWNHLPDHWFRPWLHYQFQSIPIKQISQTYSLQSISRTETGRKPRTKSCNHCSMWRSVSRSVHIHVNSLRAFTFRTDGKENRYAQKAAPWPGATPLWPSLSRPTSAPDFGGRSRPRCGERSCNESAKFTGQIPDTNRNSTGCKTSRVTRFRLATTIGIPASPHRRTRLRTPQGSSTAARRTERGLDLSDNARAPHSPTIAGMSLSVRHTNQHHYNDNRNCKTSGSLSAGTIANQSTSICANACIARSVWLLQLNPNRTRRHSPKPLPMRCFPVPQVSKNSFLRPSTPRSSHA